MPDEKKYPVPAELLFQYTQPLNVVLFRPIRFSVDPKGWLLGQTICKEDWALGCKSPEFCHTAVMLFHDDHWCLYEENWPAPRFRELDTVNWDDACVLPFQWDKLEAFGQSRMVVNSMAVDWCEGQLKTQTYGVPSIVDFCEHGTLAFLFQWLQPKQKARRETETNKGFSQVKMVCSQVVCELFLKKLGIDLLPHIAEGQECPGDLTESVWHDVTKCLGRLGQ